jgi:zona occludens toxin
MAISIHHGANGSYKTSGVVQDFAIPAIEAGRVIVSNLRGFTRDRVFDVFPDVHPDFELVHVDTEGKNGMAGRAKMARFWHWAPLGALILVDEAGVIFPKKWRQSDIDKLANYDLLEKIGKEDYVAVPDDDRPIYFEEAFEMHRHYNWDIVLSAPSISLLRPDIRATTEGAYKHRNNKFIGFGGSYMEGFHSAENNGTKASDFIVIVKKKIKPIVYKLYDSTKTGIAQDSSTGTSLLKNGRVQFLLVLLSAIFLHLGYKSFIAGETSNFDKASIDKAVPVTEQVSDVVLDDGSSSDSDLAFVDVDYSTSNQGFNIEPFYGHRFSIQASLSAKDRYLYFFTATKGSSKFPITSIQLEEAGYSVIRVTDCAATIVYKQHRQNITCGSSNTKKLGGGAESPKQPSRVF